MKNIALVINRQKDPDFKYTKQVATVLCDNGFTVLLQQPVEGLEFVSVVSEDDFYAKCDAIVTLGGDGTILEVAPIAAVAQKPILGVNLGHLGYLTQLERDDIERIPTILQAGKKCEQRFMLELALTDLDGNVQTVSALNDVTVSRQIISNTVHADLFSNDEFVYRFRCDGLIFSTPTGSTAYSMSSGGPVVDCNIKDIILVTPVCEHSFFPQSMIFSAEDTLRCRVTREKENTFIIADGKVICAASDVSEIRISKSCHTLLLFQPDGKRFYRVLNSKFSDGGAYEKS